ncbi:peroxidase family protein [Symbioplanes lichenis]|uniref:peroxidase family protein n=1 Tax=Symbioplanes lichenis TaxID=1629072 RepID=UPI00273A3BFA|nr:peroxidase family protein [Actinoplanes lichenis]
MSDLEKRPKKRPLLSDLFTVAAEYVDRRAGWDKLPTLLGLAELIGLRTRLRQANLHDTSQLPTANLPPIPPPAEHHKINRSPDGTYNDLAQPRMGMAGARFGRNVPLSSVVRPENAAVLTPNPRELSRALLTRDEFVPAETVNSLVAAWLQFMIRDWFSHGESPKDDPWVVPLTADDPWPQQPMHIMRTKPDPTRPATVDPGTPPTTVNVNSHWWDASQLYGSSVAEQQALRTGNEGKLHLDLPGEADSVPGFWLGLALLQQLFAAEHNAVCDMLHARYPAWTDEELFQRARLIVAALIAKIHTVEWTPAVISHPTTVAGMRANWYGLAGERVHNLFGRVSSSEVVSGIPGAATDHFGVPFALTEEFVAVYRMHPLIRDEWHLRAAGDDRTLREASFRDLAGPAGSKLMTEISRADLLYSFGTLPPGLVTLHNFPKFLQEYERPDGHLQDLAATDILRSRELGVPRYNEFRRLLHLDPATSFEKLTGNPDWARQISDAYDGDIEQVDLTVGMYAERLPAGFAFSDTAFRVFILMASRRLNSDRFFTDYYKPEVYTREGLKWIDNTTMADVLLRHHPSLRPALAKAPTAFHPWRRARSAAS